MVRSDIKIESVIPDKLDLDRSVYRNRVKSRERYSYRVIYKYSDLLISSDRDICENVKDPLKEIYEQLEFCIEKNPYFLKSLSPVEVKPYFPPIVKKMCQMASIFRVGPMATVAGAVCEYIADALSRYCKRLIIENGGDVYVKANRDVTIDVFLKNKCFKDKVKLLIKSYYTPCGVCSSSGSFGHSLSLGKSDLVTVISSSPIAADGAATAIANRIITVNDIKPTIDCFKKLNELGGILIIKDDKLGIWGNLELIV